VGTPGADCVNESFQDNENTFGDGCPVGSLGAVEFGTGADAAHPVVDLVFTFEGILKLSCHFSLTALVCRIVPMTASMRRQDI
jgi:hypothetical protein